MFDDNKLYLKDLESVHKFKAWIAETIKSYSGEAPNEHLLIYIDYIKDKIKEEHEIDHSEWFSAINALVSRLESLGK